MNKLIIAAIFAFFAVNCVNAQKSIDDMLKTVISSAEKSSKQMNTQVYYEMKRDPKSKKIEYSKVIVTIFDKKIAEKLEQCFQKERVNASDVKVNIGGSECYQRLIFRDDKEEKRREYMLTGSEKAGSWTLIVKTRGELLISELNKLRLNGNSIEFDGESLQQQLHDDTSKFNMTMFTDAKGNNVMIDRNGNHIRIYTDNN